VRVGLGKDLHPQAPFWPCLARQKTEVAKGKPLATLTLAKLYSAITSKSIQSNSGV
jgi:hypothetical protein